MKFDDGDGAALFEMPCMEGQPEAPPVASTAAALKQSFFTSTEKRRRHGSAKTDAIVYAKADLFDTSNWGSFCAVTLTLKQGQQHESGKWIKIEDFRCREAFRHFMNLLNRAVYGSAFRRHGKRLRVLPVLERGEISVCSFRPRERGTSSRWHIHCAIELPSHCDALALEKLIRQCWSNVEWSRGRILVRDGANAGWIKYMLKNRQKSDFDGFLDCIIIESLHNPIAGA